LKASLRDAQKCYATAAESRRQKTEGLFFHRREAPQGVAKGDERGMSHGLVPGESVAETGEGVLFFPA